MVKVGSNQYTEHIAGGTLFISYETPVAARIEDKFYRTDEFFSVTTSRHINRWLDGQEAERKPQEFFESLKKGEALEPCGS